MEDEFVILKRKLREAEKIGDKICLDFEIFDIFLRIIGRAVANIDLGEIDNARDILSELGEEIYKLIK